jgi:hypothetical protein
MGFQKPLSDHNTWSRIVVRVKVHQSAKTWSWKGWWRCVTPGTTNMTIQTFSKTKTANYYAKPCKCGDAVWASNKSQLIFTRGSAQTPWVCRLVILHSENFCLATGDYRPLRYPSIPVRNNSNKISNFLPPKRREVFPASSDHTSLRVSNTQVAAHSAGATHIWIWQFLKW